MHQKFVNNFSLDISTVVPKWLKKFFAFLFAGKIGTGPFLNAIGGKGKALTIVALSEDAVVNSKKNLKHLVKESQTPKGLNEQGVKELRKAGFYRATDKTLSSILKRLNKV